MSEKLLLLFLKFSDFFDRFNSKVYKEALTLPTPSPLSLRGQGRVDVNVLETQSCQEPRGARGPHEDGSPGTGGQGHRAQARPTACGGPRGPCVTFLHP